jgi:hypothetical protein
VLVSGSTTAGAERRTLAVAAVGAFLVFLIGGGLLLWAIWWAPEAAVVGGLNGVATTGGIISGLSVNGTAILALSGEYRAAVLDRYGSEVRFVLFGGFVLLVAASLGSAVSVVWVTQFWPRFVLAAAVPILAIVLCATAALVSSAFKWQSRPGPKQSPMK